VAGPGRIENLTPFTKDRQPKNGGRKPSQLKAFIKDNGVGLQDVSLMIKNILFTKSDDELKLLLTDTKQPMIIRLFVRAYFEDFKRGGLERFDTLMRWAYGDPKQVMELSGNLSITRDSAEERRAKLEALIAKRNSDQV
jgi:hypothetical protein